MSLEPEKIGYLITHQSTEFIARNWEGLIVDLHKMTPPTKEAKAEQIMQNSIEIIFLNGNQNEAGVKKTMKDHGLDPENTTMVVADDKGGEMVEFAKKNKMDLARAGQMPRLYAHWTTMGVC